MDKEDVKTRERLARLEQQVKEIDDDVADLAKTLAPLVRKFDRYEGRLGGVLIVISALTVALKIFWGSITGWFAP